MSFWFYLARLLVFKRMSTPLSGCSKPAICGHNPFGLFLFSLLNSPWWINTVIGDESELTSQSISTSSLSTQPMKGCTTQPRSTLEWMIFWEGFNFLRFRANHSTENSGNVLKANQTEFARLSLSQTNFRNHHQSMKRQDFQISLATYSLLIYLFIYCVFIKFLAFSRSTSGICGIACTNTTKKKEQYALRHISSFFLFASL